MYVLYVYLGNKSFWHEIKYSYLVKGALDFTLITDKKDD